MKSLLPPGDFNRIKNELERKNIPLVSAELTMLPQNYVVLDEKAAEQMIRLMDALEENDDVQNVYANFDIPDEVAARTE